MKDKENTNKLMSLLKKDKVRNAVVLIGICGIVLIYVSTLFSSKGNETDTAEEEAIAYTSTEYEAELEEKLRRVVSAITGDESPEVMVTLERNTEYIYAADEKTSISEDYGGDETKESQTNHDTEKSYIILKDADGNQHALAVTEIQPEVKGVVVVSKSADNTMMQEKIINAMKTALGISSSKICVVAQYN